MIYNKNVFHKSHTISGSPVDISDTVEVNYIRFFSIFVCQSWLWADLGLPSVRVCLAVCVCVLAGIELWIYWSDFNGTFTVIV